jgi:hypothetical protein
MIRDHLPLLAAIGCGACLACLFLALGLQAFGLSRYGIAPAIVGAIGCCFYGLRKKPEPPVEPIHEYESEVR